MTRLQASSAGPLARLASAPHRILFFGGALQALASMGWWLAELLARAALWTPSSPWSLPSPWVHSYLLAYGLFPFFIFGFLLTAMPNWLGVRARQGGWVAAALLMAGGLIVVYAGLSVAAPLAAAGTLLHAAGMIIAWSEIIRLIVVSPPADKRYPRMLATWIGCGCAGALAFAAFAITGETGFADFSRRIGIWLFLLPVFFTVSHRMIPFFSSRVLAPYEVHRPRWALWVVIGGSVVHAAMELAGAYRWLWIADLPMSATFLIVALRWGLARCFAARLLAVLHLSLLGATFSMSLYSLQSVTIIATGEAILGSAPVHAMTLGYFSAMVVAMVSRVSLGHAGHALIADNLTWLAFWGMMATALVRVAAEIPIAGHTLTALIPIAAFMWFSFFLLWASRYVPLYLRTGAEGTPA